MEVGRASYLKKREGPRLEFKSAEAIKDPQILPRAVCAFLNSNGGEIIVGLREVKGGCEPEDIQHPEAARRQLLDRLVSTLDPVPQDLEVEAPPPDAWGGWLRITVRKSSLLHAVKEKQGRVAVYERMGDRLRPLPWAEIRSRLRRSSPGDRSTRDRDMERNNTARKWWDRVDTVGGVAFREGGLRLCLQSDPLMSEVNGDNALPQDVKEWILDPTLIGIRRLGWHYSSAAGIVRRVQGHRGWYSHGDPKAGYRWLELSLRGAMRYALGRKHLEWKRPAWLKEDEHAVYPYVLLESVTSCATLLAKTLEQSSGADEVWGALQLTGIKGWRLPPGGPASMDYQYSSPTEPYPSDETQPGVVTLGAEEFIRQPHRLAWMLVRQVYVDFGYEESAIPFYDASRSAFVFDRD